MCACFMTGYLRGGGQSGYIYALQLQQITLARQTASIADQIAAGADDAMAGDYQRYGVVPDGTADRLRGYPTAALRFQPMGNVPICYDLSQGMSSRMRQTARRNGEPTGDNRGIDSGLRPEK